MDHGTTITDRTAVRAVAALTLASIAGFCFVALAVLMGWTAPIDELTIRLLRDPSDLSDAWGAPWFEETVTELTALGGYPILVLTSLIVMIALVIARRGKAALFLLLALGGGSLLSSALKAAFRRPRPDLVDHLDQTFTSSFPSAHAMVSTIVWLTLASVATRFIAHGGLRHYVMAVALLLALTIGMSRVYLGVHWPSDVVAGWLAGLGWAGATWLTADYLFGDRNRIDRFGQSAR